MIDVASEPTLLRFGVFELDLEGAELRRGGRRLRLAPQPFKVLAYLTRHAGRLVDRESLSRHVWGDTVVDFDTGLNSCLKQIRAVLDDPSTSPRFIETLPRRGYRFIAPVEPGFPSRTKTVVLGHDEALPESGARQRRPDLRRRRLWLAGTVTAIAVTALVAFVARPPAPIAPMAPPERLALAVLPFERGDGFADELIAQLANLSPDRLGVIARTSSMRFESTSKSIRQIGDELGVAYVLEGSVRRHDERLRVSVRLIDTTSEMAAWAETSEHGAGNALEAQVAVAERVSRALSEALLGERRSVESLSAQVDAAAYEAYLNGRYLLRRGTADDAERAAAFFAEAIDTEPAYAAAHAGLAEARLRLVRSGRLAVGEGYPLARRSAETALALDPAQAGAQETLARILWLWEWDWEGAAEAFRRALGRRAGDAALHQRYAFFLTSLGRHDEALEHIGRARELDPLSGAVNGDVGWIYFFARRYEDALAASLRTLVLEPDYLPALYCRAEAASRLGRRQESFDAAVAMMAASGASREELDRLRRGDPARGSDSMRAWWLAGAGRGAASVPWYSQALIHHDLGRTDQLFEALEASLRQRELWIAMLGVDPRFEDVRSDPRFQDLLERMRRPSPSRGLADIVADGRTRSFRGAK